MPSLSRADRNQRALEGELGVSHFGRSALNGTVISFGGQMARIVLQFASVAILARLLLPADFGLLAMAFTITSFVSMFTDLGLSTATLQREKISQETVSTLFFINLIAGIVLMVLTIAVAPVAAWIYDDPRVTLLTFCLSLAIPISSLGSQHGALLGRAMRWIPIQLGFLAGQAAGLATAILLLLLFDVGYWALVAQSIVGATVATLINWIACDWRPDITCNWRAAKSELHFGAHLTGFNLANWFHRQLDNVLIGWRWGPTELGYYNRAYNMLTMPINFINGPIASAVMPLLSRLQSQAREWEKYYLTALFGSCVVGYLLAVLLYLNAAEVVAILLGKEWAPAATIFALLAISMFPATPMNAAGWVYISLGRTDRMFRWGVFNSAMCVIAFIIGLPYGATGVAGAYSAMLCVTVIPCMAYTVKGSHTTLAKVLRTIAGPLAISLITISLTLFAMRWVGHDNLFLRLIIQSCLACVIYVPLAALQILLDPAQAGIRTAIQSVAQSLRNFLPFGSKRSPAAIGPEGEGAGPA